MPTAAAIQFNGMSAVKKADICICNQCGHKWIPEGKELPKRCAKHGCKSIAWNQPKRPKTNRGRKAGKAHPLKARKGRKK